MFRDLIGLHCIYECEVSLNKRVAFRFECRDFCVQPLNLVLQLLHAP